MMMCAVHTAGESIETGPESVIERNEPSRKEPDRSSSGSCRFFSIFPIHRGRAKTNVFHQNHVTPSVWQGSLLCLSHIFCILLLLRLSSWWPASVTCMLMRCCCFFFLFPLSVSLVPGVPRHNNNNSTGMLTYSFFLFDSAHAGCATRLNRPWQVRGNGRHWYTDNPR